MKRLELLTSVSLLSGMVAACLEGAAFFTSNWLALDSKNTTEHHGLWDRGINDLNCDVTPISICMFTRAGVFASIMLLLPALCCSAASVIVIFSGGSLHISATFAKEAGVFFVLADIAVLFGTLIFTLQHTTCVTSCPPKYSYYPTHLGATNFGYSFYLAWCSIFFVWISIIASFVAAMIVKKKSEVSYDVKNYPINPLPWQQSNEVEDKRV